MTTLGNSYTVPMTLEEWVQCVPWLKDDPMAEYVAKCAFVVYGNGKIAKEPREGMVRLSVPRFLDLWHDRIVLWRLEEIGFSNPFGDTYILRLEHDWNGMILTRVIRVLDGEAWVNGDDVNITTFTDLLTLIRFLTPNTNKK